MIENSTRKLSILDGGIIFLISVTLLLLANIVFGFAVPEEALQTSTYFYIVGAAEIVAVGLPPVLYMLAKKISFKSVFKKRITKEQAVLCAFLAVFAYPILGFVKLIWTLLLDVLNIPFLAQAIPSMDGFVVFLVAVVGLSLAPGLFEELIFRGIVQDSFQAKHKAAKAILLSSVFFMLMHGDVYSWTYTFTAGAILGLIYYTTGSLWASVIYHAVNNFIGMAITYFYSLAGLGDLIGGNYDLMPGAADMALGVIALSVVAVVCFGACALLFWGLTKVTKKPEPIPMPMQKEKMISYVPYIVGCVLMAVIALLPVIVQMARG